MKGILIVLCSRGPRCDLPDPADLPDLPDLSCLRDLPLSVRQRCHPWKCAAGKKFERRAASG